MPSFDCCCTLCVYLPVEQRSSVIQRIQRAAAECVALRGVLCNTSFPADPAGGERGTGAGPSTIVCLISPTCHVGMTILSTYLPHRGAVGIPVAALARRFKPPASGATQTHTVLRECLRAKDSPIWAAGAVPCRGCADETHTQSPLGQRHVPLWLCWKDWQVAPRSRLCRFLCGAHWNVALLSPPPTC